MVSATETLVYANRFMQLSAQEDFTESHHHEIVKMYTPHVPNIKTNGNDNFKWVTQCLIHPLDKRLGGPQRRYGYGYENRTPCPLC